MANDKDIRASDLSGDDNALGRYISKAGLGGIPGGLEPEQISNFFDDYLREALQKAGFNVSGDDAVYLLPGKKTGGWMVANAKSNEAAKIVGQLQALRKSALSTTTTMDVMENSIKGQVAEAVKQYAEKVKAAPTTPTTPTTPSTLKLGGPEVEGTLGDRIIKMPGAPGSEPTGSAKTLADQLRREQFRRSLLGLKEQEPENIAKTPKTLKLRGKFPEGEDGPSGEKFTKAKADQAAFLRAEAAAKEQAGSKAAAAAALHGQYRQAGGSKDVVNRAGVAPPEKSFPLALRPQDSPEFDTGMKKGAKAARAPQRRAEQAIASAARKQAKYAGVTGMARSIVEEEGKLLSGALKSPMGAAKALGGTLTAPIVSGLAVSGLGGILKEQALRSKVDALRKPSIDVMLNKARADEIRKSRLMQSLMGNPQLMVALQKQARGLQIEQTGKVSGDVEIGGLPSDGPFSDPGGLIDMLG